MKKFITHLSLAAVAGGVLLTGCGKKEEPSTTPQTAVPAAAPAAGPVELKVKWPVGKRYIERMEMIQSSETRMGASTNSMKRDMRTAQDYSVSVLKERGNGGRELELTFLNEKVETMVGGRQPLGFDSWQGTAKDAGNTAAPMFRKLLGSQVKCLTDSAGRVEQVDGFEQFKTNVVAGATPAAKEYFEAMFSEDNLKKLLATAQTLPDHPVKVGDTWPVSLEADMNPMGKLVIVMNYTFKDWEQREGRNCAKLEYTGNVTAKAGGPGIAVNVEGGKVSGVVWFDPELGTTIESQADQAMTLKIGSAPLQMTTSQNQKMLRKLVEISDTAK